jgi:homogentisate 1,2-dioxygenase
MPRHKNQRSWLYRVLPPVVHDKFQERPHPLVKADFAKEKLTPQQMRWKPMPLPKEAQTIDFVDGLTTIGTGGAGFAQLGD